jgi:Family of unknown function (DUF6232)
MAITGVAVMLAALLLQLIWPARVYVLVLRTSSGDVDAVTSRNKEFFPTFIKLLSRRLSFALCSQFRLKFAIRM